MSYSCFYIYTHCFYCTDLGRISYQPASASGSQTVGLLQGSAVPPSALRFYVVLMPGLFLPVCHVCFPCPPPVLLSIFIDGFWYWLSIHQSTQGYLSSSFRYCFPATWWPMHCSKAHHTLFLSALPGVLQLPILSPCLHCTQLSAKVRPW